MMVEQKKGQAKITIDVEINEALMVIVKESMKNMPQMMKTMMPKMPGQKKSKSE